MSVTDTIRNESGEAPASTAEATEAVASQPTTPPSSAPISTGEPAIRYATRTDAKSLEGVNKSKLVLLGGGLLVAVLFFVFTAVVGKLPKKQVAGKPTLQQAKQEAAKPPKGSVTPLMDTVHPPAAENTSGQLGPGDIRRTRSLDKDAVAKMPATKSVATGCRQRRDWHVSER